LTAKRPASAPAIDSIASGRAAIAPFLPVEPTGVPVGVVLADVSAAVPVGLLVEGAGVAAGAICD